MSLFVDGVPLPSPVADPMLPGIMDLMGAAPAVLQAVVTGGGTAGTGGAVAAGGAGTAVVVPGTAVVTAPAVMTVAPAIMAMMPGIALGILKALFIGNHLLNVKESDNISLSSNNRKPEETGEETPWLSPQTFLWIP